jgi:hypothetical protein
MDEQTGFVSNIELLRGYQTLRENPFFQALLALAKRQLTLPGFISELTPEKQDGVLYLVAQQQAMGEARGVQLVERTLDSMVADLTHRVEDDVRAANGEQPQHENQSPL